MSNPTTYLRYLPAKAKIKNRQMTGESVAIEAVKRTIFPKRYAVTQDVEIGDTLLNFVTGMEFIANTQDLEVISLGGSHAFKILAPISPAVTWEILDGAEIDVEICNQKIYEGEEWFFKHGEPFKPEKVRSALNPPMIICIGYGTTHYREKTVLFNNLEFKTYCKVKGPCGHYH